MKSQGLGRPQVGTSPHAIAIGRLKADLQTVLATVKTPDILLKKQTRKEDPRGANINQNGSPLISWNYPWKQNPDPFFSSKLQFPEVESTEVNYFHVRHTNMLKTPSALRSTLLRLPFSSARPAFAFSISRSWLGPEDGPVAAASGKMAFRALVQL